MADDVIYRAQFSALTESAVKYAFHHPGKTNRNLSDAVAARQELDLKVGCSFTRFLTRNLLLNEKPGSRLLSYGPCQTPTLYFCTERHDEIARFVSKQYWELSVTLCHGGVTVAAQSMRGRIFDSKTASSALQKVRSAQTAEVRVVRTKERSIPQPAAMNTVEMLRAASIRLGLSPARCMQLAETLYMNGVISYPRTESSRYPDSFDLEEVMQVCARHPTAGDAAKRILGSGPLRPPQLGLLVHLRSTFDWSV